MKFNFRKIASALASTAMVGSTVALAAAANFPAPFVQNGAADVAIVYGANADLPATVDVSTALSSALSSGGNAGPASTEAYPLFTSSSPIQLNNSLNSVRGTVTESNLPGVLADSSFSGNVDADLTYQLTLGPNPRVIFAKEPTNNENPGLGVLLSTSRGNYLYNASILFDKVVDFSHTDSEGENIELFGQDFLVASATDADTLVLFRSADTLFLSVGGNAPNPSQTVTVGGNTYTVELVAATDTSATIRVTDSAGQSDQKEINEAGSKKILGVEVAVNIADESTATNTLSAEVIVGADRLTLEQGSDVKVGSNQDTIDGTWVDFGGNVTAATRITIQGFAADTNHDFIVEGGDFTDPVFGAFRILFTDLTNDDQREEIMVDSSGSDKMSVSFMDSNGNDVSNFNFINNESNAWGRAFLGDSSDYQIFTNEMAKVNKSAYTVVGNEEEGYVVKLRTLSNGTTGFSSDDVVFENAFDSSQTWTGSITAEGVGTISIGGKQYTFNYVYDKTNGVSNAEYVQLNSPDSTGQGIVLYPTVETSKGAHIAFYEPLTLTLNGWTGETTGSNTQNASGFVLPDGDGFTTVTVSPETINGNWDIGGSTGDINTSVTAGGNSTVVTVGKLTYNVSSSGTIGKVRVHLMEPRAGTIITNPGLILFEEQDESNNYEAAVVRTSGAGTSDSGLGVTAVTFTFNKDGDMQTGAAYGTGKQREDNDDLYDKMDQFGTKVTIDQSDSDQYSATISYPDEQVSAMVYIDAPGSGSGTGSLGNVQVMDSELASSGNDSKNLIVVGGSCVNTVASTLLGGNAGCGASWTSATGAGSGEWIIQTFANPWASSKVATLVAGWEQSDTANAATYLTTQNPATTVGTKLKGTTSSTATTVTG
jgi:hypothetical protein